MITIILNTPRKITFKKDLDSEPWFNHDCSNENLLKQCGREGDTIRRIQFDDDKQIANLLHIYFEEKPQATEITIEFLKSQMCVTTGDLIKKLQAYPQDTPIEIADADVGGYDICHHPFGYVIMQGETVSIKHLECTAYNFIDGENFTTEDFNSIYDVDKYKL